MSGLKKCRACKNEKPLIDFSKDRRSSDGVTARCKSCFNEAARSKYKHADRKVQRHYGAVRESMWLLMSNIRHRDHDFNIDIEYLLDLWDEQEGKCYWLAIPMQTKEQGTTYHPAKVSVDRLDCALGYIKGNVVLSSCFANLGRRDFPPELFKDWLNQ